MQTILRPVTHPRHGPVRTHEHRGWSINRARDAAFASALVQWRLQRDEALLADYVDAQERTVGMVSRHLLTRVVL